MSGVDPIAIAGMIELLTPHRARGWARDGDDPLAPLRLRARDGEELLAETTLAPAPAFPPGRNARQTRAGDFCIDFPSALPYESIARVMIEAARPGEDRWQGLPRYSLLLSAPARSTRLLVPDWRRLDLQEEKKPPQPRSFWSANTETTVDWMAAKPVFVVGPVRSGTTALSLALQKGTRYRGFPEGHVLDVAIRLVNAVNLHFERKESMPPRTMSAYHIGNIHHARLFSETIEMVRRLGSGYTTPFWFDKTPTYTMVASVPILAAAWPNARFIFMKRRGLEGMRSRLRKFAKADFRGSCNDWALIMSGWRNVRDAVPGRFIEIDQRDLENDPQTAAVSVGELLGLDPSEVEGFSKVLRSERPEATGPSAQTIGDVSELGWSEEQLGIFREVCGKEMEAYGYTYDGRYQC